MKYFLIVGFMVIANLFIIGIWVPRPTHLSDFLASYNFILWSALVLVVWGIFAAAKATSGAKLSWKAVLSTLVANVISIFLGAALTSGDKITAVIFGFVLFLLPSVLVTIIIVGVSTFFCKKTPR